MSGWIKLHRSITNHWLYTEKRKFSKFEAWNDMLLNVNYSDCKTIIKGNIYEVKRGQSILSLDSWSKRWSWDKSSVRRFFNLLEKDEMIIVKSDNITTHLTICNYESYQGQCNTDDTQTKRRRNADETQTTPIKERKEYKERKEEKEYNIIPENKFSDEVISFYNEIIGYFNLTQSHTQTTKEKWLDCIDKLVRIDNLNYDQIKVIVKWARNDEFWKTNFLSILKLRNKNKDDIKYWEIFKEKSNVEYNKNNQQEISSKEVDIFARFRKS